MTKMFKVRRRVYRESVGGHYTPAGPDVRVLVEIGEDEGRQM